AGDTIATPAKVTNDGTIATKTVTETVLTALAGLSGSGTIELGASVTLTDALALTQDVEIGTGGSLTAHVVAAPFTGGKTITLSAGALDFGEALATLDLSGVTIVNGGTAGITTETASTAALNAILEAGAGGKVASTGAVDGTSITVPAATTLALGAADLTGDLTLTGTAALTTTGAVSVGGTLTTGTGAIDIGAALTLEDDVAFNGAVTVGAALTLSNNATFNGAATVPNGGSIVLEEGKYIATGVGGDIAFGGGATLGNSSTLTAGADSAATVAGSSDGVVINGPVEGAGTISLLTGSKTLKVEVGTLTWDSVVISGTTGKSTTITSAASTDTVTLNDTSGLEIGIGGKITLTDDPLSFVASNPANLALVGEGDYTVGVAEVTLNADGLHLPPEATLTFGETTGFIKGYAVADGSETEIWKIGGAAVAITSVENADSNGTGVVFKANEIKGVVGGESFTMGDGLIFTIAADATCEEVADGVGNTVVELVGVIADLSTAGTIEIAEGGVLKLAADGGIFAAASTAGGAAYGNKVSSTDASTAAGLPAASSVDSSDVGYISSTGNGESDDTVTAGAAAIDKQSTFVAVNKANVDDATNGTNDAKILVGAALE
ncbi:MAG: hypothetical protein LBT00_00805, partial [Spirochaetaceae bacterium]|nr:hypothetical protein [Spirochaetaceae bacterium]